MTNVNGKGRLVVLAGPSAVGKSTVVQRLRKEVEDLYFSVSMTTRDPRPGEVDGKDYFFVSPKSCLLYTSPSPRDRQKSRMPSSA